MREHMALFTGTVRLRKSSVLITFRPSGKLVFTLGSAERLRGVHVPRRYGIPREGHNTLRPRVKFAGNRHQQDFVAEHTHSHLVWPARGA